MTVAVEKAHAKYSASSAKRWHNCAASISLIEKAPPAVAGPWAEEGTEAHACLEYLLKERDAPRVAGAMARMQYGPEMTNHALGLVEFVNKRMKEQPDAVLLIEHKGKLDWIGKDMGGTNDVAIVETFARLTVIDYKYGAGIVVEPEENEQMLTYALQIAHEYDYNFSDVELIVWQPRAYHKDGTTRKWVCSIDTLKEFAEKTKAARKRCEAKDAKPTSGEWCGFCPAKVICPALAQAQTLAAQEAFGDDIPSELALLPKAANSDYKLTSDRLGILLKAKPKVIAYFNAVEEAAVAMLNAGAPVPGFKLVAGKANRKWIDEALVAKEARKAFGPKAFDPPSLKSPAQLEKVKEVNPKWIAKRISQISTSTRIVPESDKGDPITKAALAFSGIEEELIPVKKEKVVVKPRPGDRAKPKKRK